MSPTGKPAVGFCTCKKDEYLGVTHMPWIVEGQMVLVLDQKSLDGQVLGVLQEGDVAMVTEVSLPWLLLPEGSFVRHYQKRDGCIKLFRKGYVMKEHRSFGILLQEFSLNVARKLFDQGGFRKLPMIKVVAALPVGDEEPPVTETTEAPKSKRKKSKDAVGATSSGDANQKPTNQTGKVQGDGGAKTWSSKKKLEEKNSRAETSSDDEAAVVQVFGDRSKEVKEAVREEEATPRPRGKTLSIQAEKKEVRLAPEEAPAQKPFQLPPGVSWSDLLWLWAGDPPEGASILEDYAEAPLSPPGTPAPRRPPAYPRPHLDGVPIEGPWEADGVQFFSDFDSGNCAGVVKSTSSGSSHPSFDVLVRADNQGTEYEAAECQWFFFGMRGSFKENQVIRFQIMGLSFFTKSEKDMPQRSRLLVDGIKPLVSTSPTAPSSEWKTIKGGCDMRTMQKDGSPVLVFEHRLAAATSERDALYFALFYPYPLRTVSLYLDDIQKRFVPLNLYVNRETLCTSLEGRPIELLTITRDSDRLPQAQPPLATPEGLPLPGSMGSAARPLCFRGRESVFISARVHPGETPASFVLEGILNLLASDSTMRDKLLEKYVFHIIPVLNPDGVFLGHHRTDTRGENLNRVYGNCNPEEHPSIYAAEQACLSAHKHQGRVRLYLDLHAHSSKRGIFFLGDDRTPGAVVSRLYAYALARRFPAFEYSSSLFEDRTPGTGKTSIADLTGAICFTLETNYRRGHHNVEAFGPVLWRSLGADCLRALADLDDFQMLLHKIPGTSIPWQQRRLHTAYQTLQQAADSDTPPQELSITGPSRVAPLFAKVKMKQEGVLHRHYGGDVSPGQVVELIEKQNVSSNLTKRQSYGAKQVIFRLHCCHGNDVWIADEDLEFEKAQRGRFYYRTLSEVTVYLDCKPSARNVLRAISTGQLVEVEERRVMEGELRLKLLGDGLRRWKRPGWASEYASHEFDPRLGGVAQLMRVGFLYPSL